MTSQGGGGGYNPVYGGQRAGDRDVNGDGIELQNRLFGDESTTGEAEGGEEGRNGKVAVAAVTMADRVHTFIDADETGVTANHKSPTGSRGGLVGLVRAPEDEGRAGRAYNPLHHRGGGGRGSAARQTGLRIDEACRVLFPLNFICFNVIYWWYYSM